MGANEGPPAGVRGFGSASCLGCGALVEEHVAHLHVLGTRDGSVLFEVDSVTRTQRMTDPDAMPAGARVFLLGVAHRGCGDAAGRRVIDGTAALAATLPLVAIDTYDQ